MKDNPDISPDGSPYQYSAHPPELRPKGWQPAEPSAEPPPPPEPAAQPSAVAHAEQVVKQADDKDEELKKQKVAVADKERSSYKTRASRPLAPATRGTDQEEHDD